MKVLSELSDFFGFFPPSLTGNVGERCELQAGYTRDFPHNAHKVSESDYVVACF